MSSQRACLCRAKVQPDPHQAAPSWLRGALLVAIHHLLGEWPAVFEPGPPPQAPRRGIMSWPGNRVVKHSNVTTHKVPAMLSSSDRTAHLLRISTTIIFLLIGLGAYLFAVVVGPGAPEVVLQSIGGFLIGSVVVSYAYEYFLHEETENRTIAKLDDLLGRRVDGIFPGAAQYVFFLIVTQPPRNSFDALE